jgi:hypothetical protein
LCLIRLYYLTSSCINHRLRHLYYWLSLLLNWNYFSRYNLSGWLSWILNRISRSFTRWRSSNWSYWRSWDNFDRLNFFWLYSFWNFNWGVLAWCLLRRCCWRINFATLCWGCRWINYFSICCWLKIKFFRWSLFTINITINDDSVKIDSSHPDIGSKIVPVNKTIEKPSSPAPLNNNPK